MARPKPTNALRRVAGAAAVLLAVFLATSPALAGVVKSQSPYWFQDTYTDATSVDIPATSALVDTAGTGTVTLPFGPVGISFDPAGTYALVSTLDGIFAFVYDGQSVVPVTTWNLGNISGTAGVSWISGGSAFAAATASEVAVYGLVPNAGYTAVRVATASFSGVLGLAPGPAALSAAVLVATASGATILEAQGAALVPVSGGPAGVSGNLGVAATADGSVTATWQRGAVQLWAWDGSAYAAATAWDPPVPSAQQGAVVGVAFFPGSTGQGGGYWVLTTGGDLLGYSYGPGGAAPVTGLSTTIPTAPNAPAAIGTGWPSAPDSVGVLYRSGWTYEDLSTGAFSEDASRSLAGQDWAVYEPAAVLQSTVLPVGHTVDEVRVEDADCAAGKTPPACTGMAALPPGTAVSYAVSTDGCQTWTPAPLFTNVAVPPGDRLCYRLTLATSAPAVTPVVDVTNLYEIATVTSTATQNVAYLSQ